MLRPQPHRPLALALTLLSGLALYALIRLGQAAFAPSVTDPSAMLFDPHSGYFWRIASSAYAAGLLAPLFFWLCERRFDVASRVLGALVVGSTALLLAVALFFP